MLVRDSDRDTRASSYGKQNRFQSAVVFTAIGQFSLTRMVFLIAPAWPDLFGVHASSCGKQNRFQSAVVFTAIGQFSLTRMVFLIAPAWPDLFGGTRIQLWKAESLSIRCSFYCHRAIFPHANGLFNCTCMTRSFRGTRVQLWKAESLSIRCSFYCVGQFSFTRMIFLIAPAWPDLFGVHASSCGKQNRFAFSPH